MGTKFAVSYEGYPSLAPRLVITFFPPGTTPTPTTAPFVGSFPSTGVLDTFNRANGNIGSNWTGSPSGYTIASNRLAITSGQDIYWNPPSFGTNQEAYVDLVSVDASSDEIDLILKAQGTSWSSGAIEVLYDPSTAAYRSGLMPMGKAG